MSDKRDPSENTTDERKLDDAIAALRGREPEQAASRAVRARVWERLQSVALLDLAYQRYRHEQDLKMTKEEVKDELRSMRSQWETRTHVNNHTLARR